MTTASEYYENRKIPPGWRILEEGEDGYLWLNRKRRLSVIASIFEEQDGREWLHLSIAHQIKGRLPTYEELTYLKRHWAGPDKKCIMVLPPESEHVNFHPNCLHLFCCLTEDILPDFTWGTGLI